MDYISFDISCFISYSKTLMNKIKSVWILLISFILFWYNYSSASAMSELWQAMNTFITFTTDFFWWIAKVFKFIWEIIEFVYYWFRSIIFLLWNILQSVIFGFTGMFNWLMDTFTNLSYYMWSTTSLFVSLFCIVLLIIIFGFLLRFFTWRFHYKVFSKK